MATTDQELKKLNTTVTEAVNILKVYAGNSAQIKSMRESERQVVEKWLKVTDMAEENQKKQRAFTERARDEQGRFIKKQDQQANRFMQMAGSIKGMFGTMTTGIKNGISNMVSNAVSHMSNFFQAIKSQFLSLFGEESEWFELMSSIKDSIKGFMGSIISFIWQKTPNWAKKIIKHLHNMYLLQVKEFKKDLADIGYKKGKKTNLAGVITAFIALLGGSIGAFLGRYFGFISKLPIFSKIGQMFAKLESIPFLGKLIRAVKFGFKWIGYPLQLLIGLFDFIKAFKESEADTLWGKIKDGLWAAFEGFIKMPIELLTWITEKVLGWFGVNVDGKELADKTMGTIKKLFFMAFEGWELMFKAIKMEFDWIKPKLKEWTDLVLDYFNPLINLIIDAWNGIIEMAKELLPDWLEKKIGIDNWKMEHRGTSDTGKRIIEEERAAAKRKAEETQRVAENIEEMGKNANTNQGWVNDQIRSFKMWLSNNNQQNNTTIGDTKQLRDETDDMYMGMNAMSTGGDE